MEIQQVAGRTGQMRGTWVSGAFYNFGDVIKDGLNGSNSGNYYMAATGNTSSVWATDLAKGDWTLVIQATIPTAPLPLSVANGGTGASTPGAALNNLGGISLSGNNAFTGNNTHAGTEIFAAIGVPTAGAGDSSSKAASTAFVNNTQLTLANGTTAATQSSSDNSTKVATTAQVQTAVSGRVTAANGASLFLIATQVASGSASISFSGVPSGYDQYELRFTSIVPVTNGAQLQVQLGNPTLLASNYSWTSFESSDAPASGAHGSASASSFIITNGGISNTATIGASGECSLAGLSSANQTQITGQVLYFDGSGSVQASFGGRQGGAAGPFTVIEAKMSSGNIASGTFSLYGVSK